MSLITQDVAIKLVEREFRNSYLSTVGKNAIRSAITRNSAIDELNSRIMRQGRKHNHGTWTPHGKSKGVSS